MLEQLKLEKEPDLQHWIDLLKAEKLPFKSFERDFPSLCFALATGVGKTRLMGAMIAWLYLTGRSQHFFVLAPNLTIYEKLKQDFLPGSPKYVFQGIPELAQTPPVLITGDDYQEGRGVRLDQVQTMSATGDLFAAETAPHINILMFPRSMLWITRREPRSPSRRKYAVCRSISGTPTSTIWPTCLIWWS